MSKKLSEFRCEKIGDATLYLGDCLEVMKELGEFDAVITDPPYGINIASNPVRQKHDKKNWDSHCASSDAIQMLRKISKEQIIWGGNYFELPPSRGFLVWDKRQPENFSLAMCEQAWWSKDTNAKIFTKSVLGYKKCHPTQKPVELMEWCLTHIPNSETILDPFSGSFTTGVACIKSGRKFTGIELDEDYFEKGCQRIQDAYDRPDMFIQAEKQPEPKQEAMEI